MQKSDIVINFRHRKMKTGITGQQAKEKLKQFGYNELSAPKRKDLFALIKEIASEPMFLLLIASGSLYMILGDIREGIVMLFMVTLVIGITYVQHRKTEKALEALRLLSSPRALVLRDDQWTRIPGREVVPDDLVSLNEGDRVPADGAIIETTGLSCDESILTGESFPVDKATSDKIFSGTIVTKGQAFVRVISTGPSTEFGKIGRSLGEIEDKATQLQLEMKRFIRKMAIAGVAICVLVVFLFYLTRGNFLQSLLNGLASAMAILPEEFPVVLTVFLALGAWRLSKVKVLTRKPSAIETLGSATVFCTDKTGTLTENKLVVSEVRMLSGQVLTKTTTDTPSFCDLMEAAAKASHPESADPMEKAIRDAGKNIAYPELIREYPISHDHLTMTRVYVSEGMNFFTKGAPEVVMEMCDLDETEKNTIVRGIHEMASNGLRIIAVSGVRHPPDSLPAQQKDLRSTFLGLIGFSDPVRKEVPQAIQDCRGAGIRVIMITGDYPETARNIGRTIGLESEKVLTGSDLEHLNEEELRVELLNCSILARIRPEQKLRIVQCLQKSGETVAMTGDGVNDAPALKTADIGIAMGQKGTDVAREAASLVLLDDNFASVVSAVRLGRRIYDNLQKAMSYILAIHIPIIGLSLIPAMFPQFPILLMPLHIIFMELIIDPVSSIAFETEEDEAGVMARPPRPRTQSFFGTQRISASLLDGVLILAAVLGAYFLTQLQGDSVEEIRAICYFTLILSNVFLIFSKLSYSRSFLKSLFGKNRSARIILLIALLILFVIISIPGIKDLFQMEFPKISDLFYGIICAATALIILEFLKKLRFKEVNGHQKAPQ
jgi:Ca2+-transporting ATPase